MSPKLGFTTSDFADTMDKEFLVNLTQTHSFSLMDIINCEGLQSKVFDYQKIFTIKTHNI